MDRAATDEVLAQRAARGDEAAFTVLMQRQMAGLHRFALRYLGSHDEASEVVQQTFVSAWLALKRYDPQRPFSVWLRAIALNKCRDLSRRQKVRQMFFADRLHGAAAKRLVDTAPTAEESTLAVERERRIAAAVAKLPKSLKEPLALTVFAGLTQKDAAEFLNLTEKAVELRIARAKRRLAGDLADLKADLSLWL